ncbi:hypothetical protein EVJ58_g6828 [Rhodofomes roseus]|uniref:Uncharacterized protein n=1 Tax=Rhodofomes roseus TaxID=34475 RepID=A0A4Y9Y7J3_9APHY|nr:hypothetical protein EVJ58_g6828 [Rhodofomes roseus]
MKPVVNGIPQGSPVSPILSIIYAAEILEIFERRATVHEAAQKAGLRLPDQPSAVHLLMFVDDGKLYVSSASLDTNVRMLKIAYTVVEEWLTGVGLSPDLVKRELMHYSKKRRVNGDSPSITLPGPDGMVVVVHAEHAIKWLGVYMDRGLTFDFHVKQMAARAEKTVNGLSMLANTVRGLSQTHLRTLYTACVRPIMTYASAAWWTGRKKHVDWLEKVQHKALRLICAAFRTTPIVAMEIEAAILPVHEHLDLTSARAAVRLNKLSAYNPILGRLPEGWRVPNTVAPAPPRTTHRRITARRRTPPATTRLHRLALKSDPMDERITPLCVPPWRKTVRDYHGRLTISPAPRGITKENPDAKKSAATEHSQKMSHLNQLPDHLMLYSDGSLQEPRGVRKVGAGFLAISMEHMLFGRRIAMSPKSEVYDAEMAGLRFAATDAIIYATQTNPSIQHLHFFTDNTSAIVSIFEAKAGPSQGHSRVFREAITTFLDADPARSVEIAWTPGHQGIIGNEAADRLAKDATDLDAGHSRATRANALSRAKAQARDKWVTAWTQTAPTGRFASANRLPPQMKPRKHFLTLRREVFGRVFQCRTGHGFTGEYYRSFVPSETANCPCGEPYQTRRHILQECVQYEPHRHILRDISPSIDLPTILGTTEGITALASFLETSGAMTKTGAPRQTREVEWGAEDEPDEEEEDEAEEANNDEEDDPDPPQDD